MEGGGRGRGQVSDSESRQFSPCGRGIGRGKGRDSHRMSLMTLNDVTTEVVIINNN